MQPAAFDLDARLAQHCADAEDAEEMQTHQDDADPGCDRERVAPLAEDRAEQRSGRAEGDETRS